MSALRHPCGYREKVHANKPICGPMAVATVAEVPIEMALEACKRNMLPSQKRFGGGTYPETLSAALTELGATFAYSPPSVCKGFNMTLNRFVDEASSWGVTYIVMVTGHYVSVRDRYVIDQSQCCDIRDHRSRRRKVLGVWAIKSNSPIKLQLPVLHWF